MIHVIQLVLHDGADDGTASSKPLVNESRPGRCGRADDNPLPVERQREQRVSGDVGDRRATCGGACNCWGQAPRRCCRAAPEDDRAARFVLAIGAVHHGEAHVRVIDVDLAGCGVAHAEGDDAQALAIARYAMAVLAGGRTCRRRGRAARGG